MLQAYYCKVKMISKIVVIFMVTSLETVRIAKKRASFVELCEGAANLCKFPTSCLRDTKQRWRCLCDAYYYPNNNDECLSVGELRILNINITNVTDNSVYLSWSHKPISKSSAQFEVDYGTGKTVYANTSHIAVNGLNPNTLYTFTVKVYIPHNGDYEERKGPPFSVKTKTEQRTSTFTPVKSSYNVFTSVNTTRKTPIVTTTVLTSSKEAKSDLTSITNVLTLTGLSTSTGISSSTRNNNAFGMKTTPSFNTSEIATNDQENTVYVNIVLSVVTSLVLVLAIVIFVRRRKLRTLFCQKPVEHVDIHLSQPESVYAEVDAASEQKAYKNSSYSEIEPAQLQKEAVSSPEKLTESLPLETYAAVNIGSKKQSIPAPYSNQVSIQAHGDVSKTQNSESAVYSHLLNNSSQRRKEFENLYDG